MDWDLFQKIVAVCGGVVVIGGLFMMLMRQSSKLSTLSEGIMGKPAVTDYAGETIEKAIPSLQARVGKIEELLIGVADVSNRLVSLETWREAHDQEFSHEMVRRLLDIQEQTLTEGGFSTNNNSD